MIERRVYLDKTKDSFASSSLVNLDQFTYDTTYDAHYIYNTTEARGLFFNSSGTKMYIGKYNTGIIDEYNLSTAWDSTSATLNASKDITTPDVFNISSFCFNDSGTFLYLGTDNLPTDTNTKLVSYPLTTSWDISTVDIDSINLVNVSGKTDQPLGISISHPYSQLGTAHSYFIGYSGLYTAEGVLNGSFGSISAGISVSRSGLNPKGCFVGNSDDLVNILYTSGGVDYLYQQYNLDSYVSDKSVSLNIPDNSGDIGTVESFYIEKYGNYLYTLSTSGLVHQYTASGLYMYGSIDSGVSLQNLFYQDVTGDNSVSDYVDEGTVLVDTEDFWITVDSGVSFVYTTFNVPYFKNSSGIFLEVEYETLNSGMYLDRMQLFFDTSNASDNADIDVLIGKTVPITPQYISSGMGTETIEYSPTLDTNDQLLLFGNQYNLHSVFELYSPESGNKITGLNLLMSGELFPATGINNISLFVEGGPTHDNIDLFIEGPSVLTSGIDLFIANTVWNSSIDLFVKGHMPINSSLPLHTIAGTYYDNLDLFIHGNAPYSGNIDLFIQGHEIENSSISLFTHGITTKTDTMPLYTIGQIPSVSSGNFPLYIWSTTNSGIMNTFPMYIGSEGNPEPGNNLNLVLLGESSLTTTDTIPLYIYNDNSSAESVDLFIQNEWVLSSGFIPLFMSAPSGTLGAIPDSGSMPLYIARDSEAYATSIPLYVVGPRPVVSGLDLTIVGGNSGLTSEVDMFIKGVGLDNNNVELFTKGL